MTIRLLPSALLLAAVSAASLAWAAAGSTPRIGGHPDLSGDWFSGSGTVPPIEFDTKRAADGSIELKRAADQPQAEKIRAVGRPQVATAPKYLPKFQATVDSNWKNLSKTDRVYNCGSPGLPRIGAPQKIVHTPKEIVFLYADIAGMVWRVIPLQAPAKPSENDPSYYGDARARWDGDTLVIETTNFSDETWFGEFGYLHSDKMKVTERLTRKGGAIDYDVTVEDPGVLTAAWVKPRQTMTLAASPLLEPPPCRIDPDRETDKPDGSFHGQRF
jgi:hypothetical protein